MIHQDLRFYHTKLKNKILDYRIHDYYFSYIDKNMVMNICPNQYSPTRNYLNLIKITSYNDENNWVKMEIKTDPNNKYKYQKQSFKVTYCINGFEEENNTFFDLMSKDGKLYVYAVKYIPFQYIEFLLLEK